MVKEITKINNFSIKPFSISTNNVDCVYICQFNYILMTDLDLNYINKFGSSIVGSRIQELNNPLYMDFYNEHLYVCDAENQRIQKLSSTLCLKSTHYLDNIAPEDIKIANNLAFIKSYETSNLYICDICDFKIKYKYKRSNGPLIYIENNFYQFQILLKKISCFNKLGLLIDSIDFNLDELNQISSNDFIRLAYYNNQVIITSTSNGRLIAI